jgi:hypothetical protein
MQPEPIFHAPKSACSSDASMLPLPLPCNALILKELMYEHAE